MHDAKNAMEVNDLATVFADVSPIPQDDGPHPVCAIAYKDDFVESHDYMRAILKANERSGEFCQANVTPTPRSPQISRCSPSFIKRRTCY